MCPGHLAKCVPDIFWGTSAFARLQSNPLHYQWVWVIVMWFPCSCLVVSQHDFVHLCKSWICCTRTFDKLSALDVRSEVVRVKNNDGRLGPKLQWACWALEFDFIEAIAAGLGQLWVEHKAATFRSCVEILTMGSAPKWATWVLGTWQKTWTMGTDHLQAISTPQAWLFKNRWVPNGLQSGLQIVIVDLEFERVCTTTSPGIWAEVPHVSLPDVCCQLNLAIRWSHLPCLQVSIKHNLLLKANRKNRLSSPASGPPTKDVGQRSELRRVWRGLEKEFE